MNKNVVILIVGFIVGFIISFLYFNAQYQATGGAITSQQTSAETPTSPTTASATTSTTVSTTASKTGALEAFGANKSSSSTSKAPLAESVYKNIQTLKGVPSDQVLTVMKAFTEGLGVNCVYCHVSTEALDKDDKAIKQTARKMLEMVRQMNKTYPTNGQVTCFTCHRGAAKPVS